MFFIYMSTILQMDFNMYIIKVNVSSDLPGDQNYRYLEFLQMICIGLN